MDRFSRDTHTSAGASGGPSSAFHGYNRSRKASHGHGNAQRQQQHQASGNNSLASRANGSGADPAAFRATPPSPQQQPAPPAYSANNNSNNNNNSNATAHNNASVSQANAAASYSAAAAGDQQRDKDECTSTPFRNYNNFVKKAVIQSVIDRMATKMQVADSETAKRAEELAATHGGGGNSGMGTPHQQLSRGGMGSSLNGSFSLPPSSSSPSSGAAPPPPPPPYGTRSPAGTSNRQFYFGPNGRGINVLDLASGRGGDIGKWVYGQCPPFAKLLGQHTNDPSKFISVKQYVAVDIAPGAVEAAQSRFIETKGSERENERLMRVRHHTPLADGHFFVGNCLVGSFFETPPTAAINNAAVGSTTPLAGPMRSPSLHAASLRDLPPVGRTQRGNSMSGGSPQLPPSYTEALQQSSGGGILGRSSAPSTPHHGAASRGSPGLGPRPAPTGIERFGNSPSLGAATAAGALPPPFGGLPPTAPHGNTPQQPQPLNGLVIGGSAPPAGPASAAFLADALKAAAVDEVNIVTIQFAFHYACYSAENLRAVLRGIAGALRRGGANSSNATTDSLLNRTSGGAGGILLLTTVDGAQLSKRLIDAYNAQTAGAATVEYTSGLFSLSADAAAVGAYVYEASASALAGGLSQDEQCLPLGTMYKFKLDGLVDCEEFVIPRETLIAAAAAEGLRLVESRPFSDWLPEFEGNKKVRYQLGADGVIGANEVDLISLYRTYTFEL